MKYRPRIPLKHEYHVFFPPNLTWLQERKPNRKRISKLKEHLMWTKMNHEQEIMSACSLKDAHVMCVLLGLSAQKYGIYLEKYIRTKFGYSKNNASECSGDFSKEGRNVEVKVSLGGKTHMKFNYVQLRPSHQCDVYIFTAYHVSFTNVDEEGELYIFLLPKEDVLRFILCYGGTHTELFVNTDESQ